MQRLSLCLLLAVFVSSTHAVAIDTSVEQQEAIGIRFKGLLPGFAGAKHVGENASLLPEGTFRVEFRIYRTPQGGDPIWQETQMVEVKQGEMDVVLGTENPIPMEIHEATFKFVGASVNGGREVYPRYPVVNLVYASLEEVAGEQGSGEAREQSPERGMANNSKSVTVAARTEAPKRWQEALKHARENGGALPDYEDWYRALLHSRPEELKERTGHYEWVMPWVYDTASHGLYNNYFRGRFQGCDYMDLSPMNAYFYRLAYPTRHEE